MPTLVAARVRPVPVLVALSSLAIMSRLESAASPSDVPATPICVSPDSPIEGSSTGSVPIRWRCGTVARPTRALSPELTAEVTTKLDQLAQRADARHLIVQFDRPLTGGERETLQSAGLTLLTYLGQNGYFGSLAGNSNAAAIASGADIVSVEPIEPEQKLHPLFLAGQPPRYAIVQAGSEEAPIVAAYVLFHPDVPLAAEGVPLVEGYGAVVKDDLATVNGLVIELPMSLVSALVAEDRVQWIEPPLPRFGPVNNSNLPRIGADVAQAPPYNLTGAGVDVLVYDAGTARATHQDFGGRLTVHDFSGLIDHATHVAGTVGGSGAASGGLYTGMAPGVAIQSYGFEWDGTDIFLYSNPGDIEQDYGEAINLFGSDIANNSIGSNVEINGWPCEIQGDYGVTDQLIDNIVRGSLGGPFRIVWANGNERQGSFCDIEGFGQYYSIAPPAGAKNHITVGALNSDDDSMTWFSSWGPTDDGRMKPDISGPGCQNNDDFGVTSCGAFTDTDYTTFCGTSMASPTTCGALALLLQDYRAGFPGGDPRNSTLKILLAHTAVDLGNVGPDYQFGYGSIRIVSAIDFMRTGNFQENGVSQGGTAGYTIDVPAGTSRLKVTLAWDDAPGTPNVVPSLVNDLDLVVRAPGGAQAFPWTLAAAAPASPAQRTTRNSVDNIEQVLVDNPATGTWTVDVVGFNVPVGPQSFSICATPSLSGGPPCSPPGAPSGVVASDGASCASVAVSWTAVTGASGYSIWRNTVDDSATAAQVGSDAASPFDDASAAPGVTYFYWVRAENFCGASGFSNSDSGFRSTAGTPAPTGVSASDGTSCSSVQVTWNPVGGATSYQIWRNTVDNSATAVQIATDTASPFDDTSAIAGTTYFYWAKAVGPCETSPFSNSDSGFRSASGTAAPTGVTASDGTVCLSVQVSWNAVSGATSYQIWRNTVNNPGTATQIATDSASPFNDSTAAAGTTYFYWVRAVGPCGTSPFSNSDSGFRTGGSAPASPKQLRATDGSCNVTTVTWRASTGATSYEVWRNINNNSATATLIGTSTTTSFNDSSGTPGQPYYYWAKARNACGVSGFSNSNQGHRVNCP